MMTVSLYLQAIIVIFMICFGTILTYMAWKSELVNIISKVWIQW